MRFKGFNIPSRVIEAIAVSAFIIVAVVGAWAFATMPHAEFNRKEVLKLLGGVVGALGVVSLLLVWAQLRHTATLNKLLSYHQYFHDLPNIRKVRDLYRALGRCKIVVPTWHSPMSENDRTTLLADKEPAPDTAELVVREYLNDFEEFASAINCGLVDEVYAYQLEATRALNAYYGFRQMVNHWHAEDKQLSERSGGTIPVTTNYYGELRSVAERWKVRKQAENQKEAKIQESKRIADKLWVILHTWA
jgi:hypothetical protein